MTEKEFYKKLGEKCKEIREKENISPSKMVEKTGCSRSLLYEFETTGKKISAFRLNKIMKVLGLPTIEEGFSEKKKSVEITISVPSNDVEKENADWRERLQRIFKAAEDVVARMNHDAKIKPLRSPAAGQAEQEHQQGCES